MGILQKIIQDTDTSKYGFNEQNAFARIKICKTEAIEGYYKSKCVDPKCDTIKMNYQSCRNRSCECGFKKREEWNHKLVSEMYPVKHFHTTMTMPHELNPIYLWNKKEFTNIIMKSSRIALMIKIKEKWKCKSGGTAIFHSWGSDLKVHPHVHMIVPAGGICLKTNKWKSFKQEYIANDKALGNEFRRIFIRELKLSMKKGKITIPPEIGYIAMNAADLLDFINKLHANTWRVKSKKNSGGDAQVVKYLGRYSNRVAISSSRIKSYKNGLVTFQYKDYKNNKMDCEKTVLASEFVKSFSKHIPEKGVVKCRHFGICSGVSKKNYLAPARIFAYGKNEKSVEIIKEAWKIQNRIDKVIARASCCLDCGAEVEIVIPLKDSA